MTLKTLGMVLLIGLAGTGTAHAVTMVPVNECANCTSVQMQTMAKNQPVGFAFIYDLHVDLIRKYEVYMDSTCRPVHNGPSRGVPQGPGADSAGNGTNCGSFKAADEMFPVDATVQATFNALHDTWLHNPTLANTAKVTKVGPLPNDTNGLPFDARYVAFDYPQGSYVRFYNTVDGLISTKASANALAPDLGAYIYGWSVASVNVGALLGAEPGVTFGLSWDRTSATHFEWCVPPDLDCVEFTITRAANGTVTLTYLGVLDFDQNYYPSRNGDPPGNQNSQNFPHHGGDHFDEGMQHGGIATPQMPECGFAAHPFQVITRDGSHHIIGVAYSCQPN